MKIERTTISLTMEELKIAFNALSTCEDQDKQEVKELRRKLYGLGKAFGMLMNKPVCSTCNDTHSMILHNSSGDERNVMCTFCPRPCQECRQGGNGPFCTNTPCSCECHKK